MIKKRKMKKLRNSLLLILVLMASLVSQAQADLTLEFSQSMSTEDADLKAMIDMMGTTETKLYMKGKLVRTEISNEIMGTTIAIYDGEKGEGITLMDLYGTKTYIAINDSSTIDEVDDMKYTIVRNKKKKKILGYKCINYTITDTVGTVISISVTEKLNSSNESQYGGEIKGQALYSESIIKPDGAIITVVMEAKKVTEGEISEKMFDMSIPEGYTLSTLDGF